MAKQYKDEQDYYEQMKRNEEVFMRQIKQVKPEWFVLLDLLEKTGVNPLILWKLVRHLSNIANGSKYGNITISVENGVVTFVRGEESDRLGETILLPDKTLDNQVDKS